MEQLTEPTYTCPACAYPGPGPICSQCGEQVKTKRITLPRLIFEIPDIFDLDHGLLYTFRTFLFKPGEAIRMYFAGDRQKHYKPAKFVLFIGGIVTFLMVYNNINDGSGDKAYDVQLESAYMMMQFPLIALGTWIIFGKSGYNFGEHLVANAFIIGEVIVFKLVMFPLYLYFNGTSQVNTLDNLYLVWIVVYYTYAYYDWFYRRKTIMGLFGSLGVTVLLLIIVSLLMPFLDYILFQFGIL